MKRVCSLVFVLACLALVAAPASAQVDDYGYGPWTPDFLYPYPAGTDYFPFYGEVTDGNFNGPVTVYTAGVPNPLGPQNCVFRWVWDRNYPTTQSLTNPTGTFHDISGPVGGTPSWAFVVNLPWGIDASGGPEACGEFGWVKVIWSGQTDVKNGTLGNQGLLYVCEMEQFGVVVPCPGSHYFQPFFGRVDWMFNGQQYFNSYSGLMTVPYFTVDAPVIESQLPYIRPYAPTSGPDDVTVRVGFLDAMPDPLPNPRVLNQNLIVEVGYLTPDYQPPAPAGVDDQFRRSR